MSDAASRFSEPQSSRILAGIGQIDKLLVDIEQILTAAASQAFPKYRNPLAPEQIRVARDYISRLRRQILNVLSALNIPLPEAKFDSVHAIRVTLQFIEVAMEEIAPERLSGYGEVSESLALPLAGGLHEMKGIVRQLDSYLTQRPDVDLSNRAARLASTGNASDLLSLLSELIDRHGFVEFRRPLEQIFDKMESPAYEIAFFGRVSAGKSSLLNRIVAIDLLPTGVTPVTAVPTRIRNRPQPALLVWTADGQFNRYDLNRLAEFVTETHNAANHKRVVRLIAEVPIPMLSPEVTLVDTPGLGSLALEGAAATHAYLPQCDLGVVLVEASSNLHSDDVATVDALRTSSIPALVVLSKADLVDTADLKALVSYTANQLSNQLGVSVPVTPLSSRLEASGFLSKAELLKNWIEDEITPRMKDALRLAAASNHRKAEDLAERLMRLLQLSLKTSPLPTSASAAIATGALDAEARLREAAAALATAKTGAYGMTTQMREAAPQSITIVAERALSLWKEQRHSETLDADWLGKAINGVAQKASEELAEFVTKLAKNLSDALSVAAAATHTGPTIEAVALDELVKELPPPAFIACPLRLSRPKSFNLSLNLARHSLENQIESKCLPAITEFFVSYARSLELWLQTILNNLEQAFNSRAGVYRATLQRFKSSEPATPFTGSSALEDVHALQKALGKFDSANELQHFVS